MSDNCITLKVLIKQKNEVSRELYIYLAFILKSENNFKMLTWQKFTNHICGCVLAPPQADKAAGIYGKSLCLAIFQSISPTFLSRA